MSFEGTIVNGKVEFSGPAPLADGTLVDVVPKPPPAAEDDEPSLLFLLKLAGTAKNMPADFAGTPRRKPKVEE
jgi:hypothetical protein